MRTLSGGESTNDHGGGFTTKFVRIKIQCGEGEICSSNPHPSPPPPPPHEKGEGKLIIMSRNHKIE